MVCPIYEFVWFTVGCLELRGFYPPNWWGFTDQKRRLQRNTGTSRYSGRNSSTAAAKRNDTRSVQNDRRNLPAASLWQKGYTLGATTNLEFALPTNAAPGVSYTRINCQLLFTYTFSSHCFRSQQGRSRFPRGGRQPQRGDAKLLFVQLFAFYCIKRKTIEQWVRCTSKILVLN